MRNTSLVKYPLSAVQMFWPNKKEGEAQDLGGVKEMGWTPPSRRAPYNRLWRWSSHKRSLHTGDFCLCAPDGDDPDGDGVISVVLSQEVDPRATSEDGAKNLRFPPRVADPHPAEPSPTPLLAGCSWIESGTQSQKRYSNKKQPAFPNRAGDLQKKIRPIGGSHPVEVRFFVSEGVQWPSHVNHIPGKKTVCIKNVRSTHRSGWKKERRWPRDLVPLPTHTSPHLAHVWSSPCTSVGSPSNRSWAPRLPKSLTFLTPNSAIGGRVIEERVR